MATILRGHFNPRSREGSDLLWIDPVGLVMNFNPRSREGRDELLIAYSEMALISIHAPVKGATLIGTPMRLGISDFNPRSREGSDQGR